MKGAEKIPYEYNPEENIVYAYPEGIMVIADIQDYIERVLVDSNIQPGFIEVVDFAKVDDFNFSFKNLLVLQGKFEKFAEEKQHQGAILIAVNDLQSSLK